MAASQSKLEDIIGQRVLSLVNDGYFLVYIYSGVDERIVKLRHRSNGNVITISANVAANTMQQNTNGKVTYSGMIQP